MQQPAPSLTFDLVTLRNALGRFLTGVTVVTTAGLDGEPVGMTANAFTSVSLDPPLVLVCVGRSAASFASMERATYYAVHVLGENQEEVSATFAHSASEGFDKFVGVSWTPGDGGLPLLDDYLARFVCHVVSRVEAGDHVIYIGRIEDLDVNEDRRPLGFYGGRYAQLA